MPSSGFKLDDLVVHRDSAGTHLNDVGRITQVLLPQFKEVYPVVVRWSDGAVDQFNQHGKCLDHPFEIFPVKSLVPSKKLSEGIKKLKDAEQAWIDAAKPYVLKWMHEGSEPGQIMVSNEDWGLDGPNGYLKCSITYKDDPEIVDGTYYTEWEFELDVGEDVLPEAMYTDAELREPRNTTEAT